MIETEAYICPAIIAGDTKARNKLDNYWLTIDEWRSSDDIADLKAAHEYGNSPVCPLVNECGLAYVFRKLADRDKSEVSDQQLLGLAHDNGIKCAHNRLGLFFSLEKAIATVLSKVI